MKGLDAHLITLIQEKNYQKRTRIFIELLSRTEKIMLAKRLGIIFLLKKGVPSYKVGELLGVSSSTARRFEYFLESKRYRTTEDWLWRKTEEGKFHTFMEKLVRLAFTGRTRSFSESVAEIE